MIRVVTECNVCPFCHRVEGIRRCAVSSPKMKGIHEEADRPSWCVLRREAVIVRGAE